MQQYRCFRNPGPLTETIPAPQAAREPSSRAAFAFSIPAFSWLPYAILLLWAYAVFCVTPDDPYITYRYAANLLAGHGPVFNIGERVEGFSSPLHLLLSALLLRAAPTVDILFKAKLLGLAFALLSVWQTGKLARDAGLLPGYVLTAQLLVAANIMFAQAAVNGLETTLYALLLLLTPACLCGRGRRRGRRLVCFPAVRRFAGAA